MFLAMDFWDGIDDSRYEIRFLGAIAGYQSGVMVTAKSRLDSPYSDPRCCLYRWRLRIVLGIGYRLQTS